MMKKRWFRMGKIILAAIMIFTVSMQVYADSMDDAQQDKEEAEENKSEAEVILATLEEKKDDLSDYITELDSQLSDLQTEIDSLNAKKAELEEEIEKKQQELETAKQEEEAQYAAMCSRIQFMYENNTVDYMSALLTAESMSDILNTPEYAEAIANYDYNLLNQLIETRESIAAAEKSLQEDLEQVEELAVQVEEEENTVNVLIAAKQEELEDYNDQIEYQEVLVAQYDAEIQAAASQIAAIEAAAEAAAAEAAAAAANSVASSESAEESDESSGTSNTSAATSYTPYSGGALTWPVPSSYSISSGFGLRESDGGVVTANHYGIDIRCANGTPCVAAASGVVVLAQYSSTAGYWIIISHGNGLYTIYMHASELYVSAGQYVNAGDTIMLSGATGATQGNHLHFEVRVGGYLTSQYSVDPMNYY